MRLSKATITHSSRVMLIVYPVFALLVGLSYLLGDPDRTASPSFDVVRNIMPMRFWGIVFLALCAVKTTAWLAGSRAAMVAGLRLGLAVYAAWTVGFAASLLNFRAWPPVNDEVSFNAVWLWAFVAFAHVASIQSLNRDSPRR